MTAVLVGTLFSYVIVRQQATFTGRHVHRAGRARTGHVLSYIASAGRSPSQPVLRYLQVDK